MRNYVFIKNRDVQDRVEELLGDNTSLGNVDVSYNRKGLVITFKDAYSADVLNTHVEDERNEVATALVIEPYTPQERKRAQDYVRSLSRVSKELLDIVVKLKKNK